MHGVHVHMCVCARGVCVCVLCVFVCVCVLCVRVLWLWPEVACYRVPWPGLACGFLRTLASQGHTAITPLCACRSWNGFIDAKSGVHAGRGFVNPTARLRRQTPGCLRLRSVNCARF